MFRGPSWDDHLLRPAVHPDNPKIAFRRVAQSKDHLFRRLVPACRALAPEGTAALPAAEIGSLVTCRTFEPLPVIR
ncbi:hypothetical protein H8M03_01130 [Sphingomonas sabuli]|uniref:Uncharacterized protein n=1 Tax=Sphingomonas sabuli TaxID=2764186 RepID=A0A7G9L2Z9_9SPHN|nr:hypothetical protein [Sphingomonas sabuli]QNM82998.1 hypothetical protein H8M03_01130 [Sphingomonas sabuli]